MARKSNWSPLVVMAMVAVLLAAAGAVTWAYLNRENQLSIPAEAAAGVTEDMNPPATDAELASAQHAVSSEGILALAVKRFHLGMGRYPSDLDELVNKPAYLERGERWIGPYVNNPRLLEDSWGRALRFECPGTHNETSYDIWSVGPDGQDGTGDDIGNW